MRLGNECYTVGKPVYFPFKWCHIRKEHAFLMSSRAEYLGCAHEYFAKSSLPNSLFCCWLLFGGLGGLMAEESRHTGNLIIYSFNKQECLEEPHTATAAWILLLMLVTSRVNLQRKLPLDKTGSLWQSHQVFVVYTQAAMKSHNSLLECSLPLKFHMYYKF